MTLFHSIAIKWANVIVGTMTICPDGVFNCFPSNVIVYHFFVSVEAVAVSSSGALELVVVGTSDDTSCDGGGRGCSIVVVEFVGTTSTTSTIL